MRAMSMMRFVVLGAVGFGLGGATALLMLAHVQDWGLLLGPLIGGAVGGASLGLASKDFRRALILALLSLLGLTIGVMAGLSLGSFFNHSPVAIAAMVGVAVGASLGLGFGDWRPILALAVAGMVGFSVGVLTGDFLRFHLPRLREVGEAWSIIVAGVIGGASLGAALGYLEGQSGRPR